MGSILLGLVPALGWGFQGIVMQKVGGNTANKQMGMVLSTLVLAIVIFFIHPVNWSGTLIAAAAINGIPWSVGQILQIKSFDYLGVARAMPLSTGMQLVMATLVGAFAFGEWHATWQFFAGFAALALIIAGVAMTAYQEKSEDAGPSNLKLGLIITFISSLMFVAYATAARFFSVDSMDLMFPQALFMFASTLVIACFMTKRDAKGGMADPEEGVLGKKSWLNMSAGVLFAIANFTVMLSNQLNGVAVGWTLSQMNVIVATLGGLFILHEHKTPRELRFVIAGMVLIAVGGILIGVTKVG